MSERRGQEPMLDLARGDKAVSQHLAESLKVLRDRSEDKDFRRLIDDILNGQMPLRQAAFYSELFDRGIGEPLEEGLRHYDQLSEVERDRMAAEGDAEFARINAEIAETEAREHRR